MKMRFFSKCTYWVNAYRRLCLLMLFVLMGHFGFSQQVLTFCNKSTLPVDSVVIDGSNERNIFDIPANRCTDFLVPTSWITHGAVVCNYKVYFKDSYYTGQVFKGASNFTINLDKSFLSQSDFTVLVNNTSKRKIDSVFFPCCSIDSNYNVTPRVKAYLVNQKDLQKNPQLKFVIAGTNHTVSLDSAELKNFSSSTTTIWINDTAILNIVPPFSEFVEFQIILQPAKRDVDLSSIRIKSPALETIKLLSSSAGMVISFNLDKLRKKSTVIVEFESKRLKIKLSKGDLSETYFGRKYYFVSRDSIIEQY
jgi:hypothetical protein